MKKKFNGEIIPYFIFISGVPILWIKFFDMDIGFSWSKISIMCLAFIGTYFLAKSLSEKNEKE